MNVDSVIVPGGYTKYIQAFDGCLNKPFKTRVAELYDQCLSECVHKFTEGGNMKLRSRKIMIKWVLDPWSHLSKESIDSLKCCDFNLANDGTNDGIIHCLKKGQPCEPGREKLNSELSIIVDENDAVNTFIYLYTSKK